MTFLNLFAQCDGLLGLVCELLLIVGNMILRLHRNADHLRKWPSWAYLPIPVALFAFFEISCGTVRMKKPMCTRCNGGQTSNNFSQECMILKDGLLGHLGLLCQLYTNMVELVKAL